MRLALDDFPVPVIDEFEAFGQQPNADDEDTHHPRQQGRANDIHEQTITRLVRLVNRLMQQGVVEYEKLVVAPIVCLVADDDVSRGIGYVVEIIQNPQRRAHEAEMLAGGDLLVEDGNPDRLNITPGPMKRRNIQESVEIGAVPSEENHGPGELLCPLL